MRLGIRRFPMHWWSSWGNCWLGGQGIDRKIRPPSMYKVLLHNDHYTTMEFVVDILASVFNKPGAEAIRIMLNVHENGLGLAGVYTSSIAETKVATVHDRARDHRVEP